MCGLVKDLMAQLLSRLTQLPQEQQCYYVTEKIWGNGKACDACFCPGWDCGLLLSLFGGAGCTAEHGATTICVRCRITIVCVYQP